MSSALEFLRSQIEKEKELQAEMLRRAALFEDSIRGFMRKIEKSQEDQRSYEEAVARLCQ